MLAVPGTTSLACVISLTRAYFLYISCKEGLIPDNRLPLTTSIESPFIAQCLSRNGIVLAQVPATHSQNAHV